MSERESNCKWGLKTEECRNSTAWICTYKIPYALMDRQGYDNKMRINECICQPDRCRCYEESKHGCHCDLEPGQVPDDCVIDSGDYCDCLYANVGNKWNVCNINKRTPSLSDCCQYYANILLDDIEQKVVFNRHSEYPIKWAFSYNDLELESFMERLRIERSEYFGNRG